MQLKTPSYNGYRIKLLIAIEKNGFISTKNEIIVPDKFLSLDEARDDVFCDMRDRLDNAMYFKSSKVGFDLVKYGNNYTCNTYIAYRIVPIKSSNRLIQTNSINKLA